MAATTVELAGGGAKGARRQAAPRAWRSWAPVPGRPLSSSAPPWRPAEQMAAASRSSRVAEPSATPVVGSSTPAAGSHPGPPSTGGREQPSQTATPLTEHSAASRDGAPTAPGVDSTTYVAIVPASDAGTEHTAGAKKRMGAAKKPMEGRRSAWQERRSPRAGRRSAWTAKKRMGRAKKRMGRAKKRMGRAKKLTGTAKASMGKAKKLRPVGTAKASMGKAKKLRPVGTAKASMGTAKKLRHVGRSQEAHGQSEEAVAHGKSEESPWAKRRSRGTWEERRSPREWQWPMTRRLLRPRRGSIEQ